MPKRFTIKTMAEIAPVVIHIEDRLKKGKSVTLTETAEKRTIPQNAIKEVWYREISKQRGDISIIAAKRYSKLHCGVPLLRAESATFRRLYDMMIKRNQAFIDGCDGLSGYQLKLEAMDVLPVTSLMTVDQLSVYLREMQDYWQRGDVFLNFPSDSGLSGYPEAQQQRSH